jgi:hypothetical protein
VFEVVAGRYRLLVRVRVVEADHVEAARAGVALAAHQLFGADEEAVALGLLLARVRDRVGLDDLLAPARGEAADEQAAALVRVITLAVGAHLRVVRVGQ